MVIQPKVRGFICTTAHPEGCRQNVKHQIDYVVSQNKLQPQDLRVLVLGSSTGYGLASRISLAFGGRAKTIGVAFDKAPSGSKTGTAGWYNTAAFEEFAHAQGLYAKSLNADAFSDGTKAQVIDLIKKDLGQIDLVVYSLASPVRVDPRTGEKYRSVIKPCGKPFTNKSIDVSKRTVETVTIDPATQEETTATVKVMGGEDWALWIHALMDSGALAQGAKTVAFNYLGPVVTHPIYRDGTIGYAKKHLEQTARELSAVLTPIGGSAYISVNKALVTQASSAIPVVPLYISILYKVMKEKGIHEGCIEQMYRLYSDRLLRAEVPTDGQGFIRMDDWEMRPDVQAAVSEAWNQINTENLAQLTDLDGYETDFYQLFGFRVPGVDESQDVQIDISIPSIAQG